jgi:hypothetical protein
MNSARHKSDQAKKLYGEWVRFLEVPGERVETILERVFRVDLAYVAQ